MSTPLTPPPPIPEPLLRVAAAAHASPPRAYHSFDHATAVLALVDDVALTPGWNHHLEARLAALFHDAIYVPGRSDNETKSADLALTSIAEHFPSAAIDPLRLRRLIELTARHGHLDPATLDHDQQLFLDCDMAILAADDATFDAYDAGIASEYRHLPTLIYRFNRRRFLQRLLDAPRIFLSDHFHHRLDARARHNLRRALSA